MTSLDFLYRALKTKKVKGRSRYAYKMNGRSSACILGKSGEPMIKSKKGTKSVLAAGEPGVMETIRQPRGGELPIYQYDLNKIMIFKYNF